MFGLGTKKNQNISYATGFQEKTPFIFAQFNDNQRQNIRHLPALSKLGLPQDHKYYEMQFPCFGYINKCDLCACD